MDSPSGNNSTHIGVTGPQQYSNLALVLMTIYTFIFSEHCVLVYSPNEYKSLLQHMPLYVFDMVAKQRTITYLITFVKKDCHTEGSYKASYKFFPQRFQAEPTKKQRRLAQTTSCT